MGHPAHQPGRQFSFKLSKFISATFLLAGAVDERAPRGAVRGGDPHQVHVPDELRQVSHGQADLQIPSKNKMRIIITNKFLTKL